MVPQLARVARRRHRLVRGRERRVGLTILIPGCPQLALGRRERGLVLLASFASAIGVGLFTWGTRVSLVTLLFAFGTHVVSLAEVIRHGAFPGFGRWVPPLSASAGLGLGCYAPALALASVLALPAVDPDAPSRTYAINRWSYRGSDPGAGDRVLLRAAEGESPRLARVIATEGQSVEWAEDRLRIAGGPVIETLDRPTCQPIALTFEVPRGHLLVLDGAEGPRALFRRGPRLVARDRVVGRAWARIYPIRDRRLLD